MTTCDDAPTRSNGSNAVDDLVDRLLAELEGERTETRTAALRRALAAEGGAGARPDADGNARADPAARREHLESAVASLAAYADALEATLDDRGGVAPAGERADLDAIEEDLAALHETVAELEAADSGFESRVDEYADRVDHLDERIESRTAVLEDRLERRAGDLEDRIDDLDRRADDIDRRIDDTVAVVEERAATVDDGLRTLEDRILDLEENAEAAAEWRKSLQSVLR